MPVVTPASSCDVEDCPHTNSNGFRGRVCDPNCEDGIPYGTNGCGAREGRFGVLCRVCYNDVGRALANDDPDNRAIMYVKYLTEAYSMANATSTACQRFVLSDVMRYYHTVTIPWYVPSRVLPS